MPWPSRWRIFPPRTEHRILFVVGGFHVAAHVGTVARCLVRRPDDSVKVLLMQPREREPLELTAEERGEGDAILLVRPE
jgi:hypothetical protein